VCSQHTTHSVLDPTSASSSSENVKPPEDLDESGVFDDIDKVLNSRGKFGPFWSSKAKSMSDSIWLPNKSLPEVLGDKLKNLRALPNTGWFKNIFREPNKKEIPSPSQLEEDSVSSDSDDSEPETILRTDKYRLRPNKEQIKILTKLIGVFRWFYNRTIDFIDENPMYNEKGKRVFEPEKIKTLMKRREDFLPEWFHTLEANGEKLIVHKRVMDEAIRDCCKAHKTAYAQVINPEMKYKTRKDDKQCLVVSKDAVKKKGIFLLSGVGLIKSFRKAGKLKTYLDYETVEHDLEIGLTKKGVWTLYVPVSVSKSKLKPNGGCISLDSGIRTFQTGYSPEGHVVELGTNLSSRVASGLRRIDAMTTKATKPGCDRKQRKKLYSRIKRIKQKNRNLVRDMHWKIAHYLTSNYKTIVVSDFGVSKLMKSTLHWKSKRLLSIGSHYLFKLRLKSKCESRGVRVFFMDESYTSKTCTSCGHQHETLGSSKVFDCPGCGLVIDRDINASRNILIKNWDYLPPA
jgi:IS605 OrfB family transposase